MTKKPSRPTQTFSLRNLERIWRDSKDGVRNSKKASGIDGVSASDFRQDLQNNLSTLSTEVCSGEYVPQNLRPIFIEKKNGKKRIICVPTVRDRLVQRVILARLTFNFKTQKAQDLLKSSSSISFGVRKGKEQGVQAALKRAIELRKRKRFVVKTDISAFFDRIPRNYLKELISRVLKDSNLVNLLHKFIDSEIHTTSADEVKIIKNSGVEVGRGLRQGMPLSPLLSNLVLGNFDKELAKENLDSLRYVDDLICFCDTREKCEALVLKIKSELAKVSLEIPDLDVEGTKTEIFNPDEVVEFLGVDIYLQPSGDYAQKIPDAAIKDAMADINSYASIETCQKEGLNFHKVMSKLENKIQGYSASYKSCTNLESFLQNLAMDAKKVKQSLLSSGIGNDVLSRMSNKHKSFFGFD